MLQDGVREAMESVVFFPVPERKTGAGVAWRIDLEWVQEEAPITDGSAFHDEISSI